jgi:MoxR-like ATPase
MSDWKIFLGNGTQHDGLLNLPEAPPWRISSSSGGLSRPPGLDLKKDFARAEPFLPTEGMILAVNAALYLRRPLLLTGKPGTGKSTLISKAAYELKLGPVLRWPITSRSTVRNGVYEYDAVGRLQASKQEDPPVEQFLTLGPLGTALMAQTWPRPLLIDEIDKSDLDFANDLLNVIEEGDYEIPELRRLGKEKVRVRDAFGELAQIHEGRIHCGQFPFVVMTSNAEREFPPPFLRRCIRLGVEQPTPEQLSAILKSHLKHYSKKMNSKQALEDVKALVDEFTGRRAKNQDVATDQLLNAVFLTVALRDEEARSFAPNELAALRENLFRQLSGQGT